MTSEYEMRLLYAPETPDLRFLPEGPYPYGENELTWVAIQHGPNSTTGSLNRLHLATGRNERFPLSGRPGFAFPTTTPNQFFIGLERCVTLFDAATLTYKRLSPELDADVAGTVINDAVAFSRGVIIGCKDLKFAEAKAGLYLWRYADQQLISLGHNQTCSNGKVVWEHDDEVVLLNIDTPTKQVVRYTVDVAGGRLGEPRTVLDLTALDMYPDGMIATPDEQGVIISFYNPHDAAAGETRAYRLADGACTAIWKTPLAPQATCPQLVRTPGGIRLVVTTAVEHMSAERFAVHSRSGCLFIGDTPYDSLPPTPLVQCGAM